jgi:hypothetical protein
VNKYTPTGKTREDIFDPGETSTKKMQQDRMAFNLFLLLLMMVIMLIIIMVK